MIWLLFSVITVTVVIIVVRKHKRPGRIMREGKLLKSEVVFRKGERFYVEKVAFKDWHASLHSFFWKTTLMRLTGKWKSLLLSEVWQGQSSKWNGNRIRIRR